MTPRLANNYLTGEVGEMAQVPLFYKAELNIMNSKLVYDSKAGKQLFDRRGG